MLIETRAYARAGLIGNPSDGYFGKTISVIVKDFSARVLCYESPRLTIMPQECDRTRYADLTELGQDVDRHGYYGGVRLLKAALKRFADECAVRGVELPPRHCTLEYSTDVPVRVGLAGSSAIVTATIRALQQFYEVQFSQPVLPNVILSVERDELGIGAGLQDRVVQVYEGAVFMDFERSYMERHGHGQYESLDPSLLPPLFVAYHDHLAEGTELTHNPLKERFNRGDPQVLEAVARWADLAEQARTAIVARRGGEIGPLMNENLDLRAAVVGISDGNRRLVEIGRDLGAATKFAGSGGAVIGTYDGDPERLTRLRLAYEDFGAKLVVPVVE